MKVLFCGGGTAGHITPALAMADILGQNFKNTKFAFVGRSGGAENEAIIREDKKLYTLSVSGLSRSLSPRNIKAVLRAIRATGEAKEIIREFEPDLIIGTGGYVSYPVLRAGIRLGLPTMLHESNATPGLVTRLIGKRCDRLLLSYPECKRELRANNAVVTGNPTRRLKLLPYNEARERLGIRKEEFFILSFGGSLGAKKINEAISGVFKQYSTRKRNTVHIHSSGRSGFPDMKMLNNTTSKSKVMPYIHDMPLYLSAADLAITRSGAMTVSELRDAKLPSILIPSPNVTANHQFKNALALSELGGALIIEEDDLTADILIEKIELLRQDRRRLSEMKNSLKSHPAPDTQDILIGEVSALVGDKATKY